MPRYRMDGNLPAIECCDTIYELTDGTLYCDDCGDVFDWTEVLQYWNVEDYMGVLDAELAYELDIDFEVLGVDPSDYEEDLDDDDTSNWVYQDNYGKNGQQLELTDVIKRRKPEWQDDLDAYLGLPFDGKKDGSRPSWMDGASLNPSSAAKPPTAHLREHHRPRYHKDPFLDVEIPNEVL